jgi:hypothetical protein
MRPASAAGLKASPERRPAHAGRSRSPSTGLGAMSLSNGPSTNLGLGSNRRGREYVERPGGQIIHFYVNNPG